MPSKIINIVAIGDKKLANLLKKLEENGYHWADKRKPTQWRPDKRLIYVITLWDDMEITYISRISTFDDLMEIYTEDVYGIVSIYDEVEDLKED